MRYIQYVLMLTGDRNISIPDNDGYSGAAFSEDYPSECQQGLSFWLGAEADNI